MRLLIELAKLRDKEATVGFVELAQKLASFEEQVEQQRKFRDLEDGSLEERSSRALAADYDAIPIVPLPEFLPPYYPPPNPPESGTRLSRDYFGPKTRISGKTCAICRLPGHNKKTCTYGHEENVPLPLHLVSKAK